MEKKYNECQSCGMPFRNDPEKGGTNSDGSRSAKFCSYCYQNGAFTQPDFTVDQMQQFVKGKLKELGIFHRLFAGPMSKVVYKLERWKQ